MTETKEIYGEVLHDSAAGIPTALQLIEAWGDEARVRYSGLAAQFLLGSVASMVYAGYLDSYIESLTLNELKALILKNAYNDGRVIQW